LDVGEELREEHTSIFARRKKNMRKAICRVVIIELSTKVSSGNFSLEEFSILCNWKEEKTMRYPPMMYQHDLTSTLQNHKKQPLLLGRTMLRMSMMRILVRR
jgi:hypothetical protein